MTTATKTKTTPGSELRAAERKRDQAQAERDRIDREYRQWSEGLRSDEAHLGHLARTSPEQFAAGHPKARSEAAQIKARIDAAKEPHHWPEIISGADAKVAEAEAEIRSLLDRDSVELALAEFRGGEDDLDALAEPVEQILAIIGKLREREAKLIQIADATRGRKLNRQDISWDQRLDALRDLLQAHRDYRPPRSATLTPLVGETPRLRRTAGGGWIEHFDSPTELGEQPEPIEARR